MLNELLTHSTRAASRLLGSAGAHGYLRSPGDLRAVFYHGVGEGRSPWMRFLRDEVNAQVFTAQLDYLTAHYRIVGLSDAVDAIETGRAFSKPACCLSFDDGLASVYTTAFPLLRARRLPFCVFVNTATVDNRAMLWQHALSILIDRYGLAVVQEQIARCCRAVGASLSATASTPAQLLLWWREHFDLLRRRDILGGVMTALTENTASLAAEARAYVTWDWLREMRGAGAEVFSHTHSHAPLDRLQDSVEIEQELSCAMTQLEDAGFTDHRFVSFPFGMLSDYGRRALDLAFQVGHRYAVEVGDGMNEPAHLRTTRLIARVDLGNAGNAHHDLHAAIELRPLIKSKLRTMLARGGHQRTDGTPAPLGSDVPSGATTRRSI